MPVLTCKRCKYSWEQKKINPPETCPKCKKRWNVEPSKKLNRANIHYREDQAKIVEQLRAAGKLDAIFQEALDAHRE